MSEIEVPKGWEYLDLVPDVCKMVSGNGFPKEYQNLVSNGTPFIKVSDMNSHGNEKYIRNSNFYVNDEIVGKINAKKYPKGTIIFPKIGGAILTNKKRILSEESCFDNNVMGLIPIKKIDESFLYYFLQKIDLKKYVQNGPVPSLDTKKFSTIEICLPPLETQKKIVQKLDYILGHLEEKKKRIHNYKKILIEYLDILTESTRKYFLSYYLPSKINSKYPLKPLEVICHKIVDPDHKMPQAVSNGTPLISTKNFTKTGKIDFRNPKKISYEDYKISTRRCNPEFGDIIFSRYGTVGKSVQITTHDKFAISYSLVLLKPNKEIVLSDYLFFWLNSISILKEAKEGIRGIAIPDLGIKTIRKFEIPLPTLSEQKQICEVIIEKQRKWNEAADNITKLDTISQNLQIGISTLEERILNSAFSGKLVK